jgi:hypothetical protein
MREKLYIFIQVTKFNLPQNYNESLEKILLVFSSMYEIALKRGSYHLELYCKRKNICHGLNFFNFVGRRDQQN